MIIKATVTEILRNFSDYVNRVAYRGERFTLLRGGKPVAELAPVPLGMRLGDLPNLLASLPRLSEEEVEAYASDMEEGRRQLSEIGVDDPWAS